MGTPAPEKRLRKWAPKRRTGCASCKQRRLRCDETKPTCKRCLKDGFECTWPNPVAKTPKARQAEGQANANSPSPLSNNELSPSQTNGAVLAPKNIGSRAKTGALASPAQSMYVTPSSPFNKQADYIYLSYFLRNVAPLMSTTKPWRTFWQVTVPQSAWTSDAARHGLIAMAASYEGLTDDPEKHAVVLKEVNLAIGAFRQEQSPRLLAAASHSNGAIAPYRQDLDIALLLCRVLASVYQAKKEWRLAQAHMGWGAKILRQLLNETGSGIDNGPQTTRPLSDIARTIAPVFMCVLNEDLTDDDDLVISRGLDDGKRKIWSELLRFRSIFKEYYQNWIEQLWPSVNRILKAQLLTSWSTINLAISSTKYPTLVSFGKDTPIVPADKIEEELRRSGKLYSLGHLTAFANYLLQDIDAFLQNLPGLDSVEQLLGERLQTCIENYLVQAFYLEPRMSAGTCWSNNPEPICKIITHLGLNRAGEILPNVFDVEGELLTGVVMDLDPDDERQNFYLEHVCPYRSGLTPAGCDEDLCTLTDHPSHP